MVIGTSLQVSLRRVFNSMQTFESDRVPARASDRDATILACGGRNVRIEAVVLLSHQQRTSR